MFLYLLTTPNQEITINNVIYEQSSDPFPEFTEDYVINRYKNISSDYKRKTEQVPFSLQQPGAFSLKRRDTAYKTTRGDSNE